MQQVNNKWLKKKTKKRASQLTKAEKIRVGEIATEILSDLYPDAVSSLNSDGDPWRLLIMARLSAQCTDCTCKRSRT